jgi:hypothetical protein
MVDVRASNARLPLRDILAEAQLTVPVTASSAMWPWLPRMSTWG